MMKKFPQIIDSPSLMQAMSLGQRREGQTIGFVPTMGALHDGHLALIREARLRADFVVVSIFVNPKQFDKDADLSKYPKTFAHDVKLCCAAGVDVIFSPSADALYPTGFCTNISVASLGETLEGASRAGHFDGVCTVVASLFSIVQPHFSVFGEKDFQQLVIVKRLVKDLFLPVEIVAMPVMRDVDGLALSSRNIRIAAEDRARALCLFQALTQVQEQVLEGELDALSLQKEAQARLENTPNFVLDYALIVDDKNLMEVEKIHAGVRLLLAGVIGLGKNQVRLLDNGPLFLRQ